MRFVGQVNAILTEPEPGKLPLRLFAPYERPDEKPVIRQTTLLEASPGKSQIAILENTVSQISRALGQNS